MRYTNQVVTVLERPFSSFLISRAIIQRQVRDVMVALKLFQHVVSADLSALINRMKQFSFEPENSQTRKSKVGVLWDVYEEHCASSACGCSVDKAASPSKNCRCQISKFTSDHNRSSWFSPSWCRRTISRTTSGSNIPLALARSLSTYSSMIER